MGINLSSISALVDRSTLLILLSDEANTLMSSTYSKWVTLGPYKLRKPITLGNILVSRQPGFRHKVPRRCQSDFPLGRPSLNLMVEEVSDSPAL